MDEQPKPRRRRRPRKRRQDAPQPPRGEETPPPPAGGDSGPWSALGLDEPLLAATRRLAFEKPTDIQRELIPHALAGSDCLGQARTGTGKTAAFAIPMLQRLEPGGGLQALVLTPTRELALQVDEHVEALGKEKPLRRAVILGGRRMRSQIAALKMHPEIVVGTPGRILDLMRRKELDISGVRLAVLDEVDRMLDIGFRDDIRRILRAIEAKHQTIFVSATLDEEIQKLARSFMTDPVEVNVSHDMLTVEGIHQGFVSVHPGDKYNTLLGFLKHEAPTLAIVFTNTKHKARRLAQYLKKHNVNCREIHGDLVQERRERVMKSFRTQRIQVLVATDLASRGLDVMDISHIVNFDVPEDSSAYVHRIGRTARMGKTGYAVMFVTPEEGKALTDIEKLINKEVPQFDPPWLVKREPTAEEVAAATAAEHVAPVDAASSTRLSDPTHRDAELDAIGLRPVKRTLGSRFRAARKFRR
jgi:ATP-dependent RNA helicase DeaD